MTIADIKKTLDTKMDQSITALKNNLSKVRTGRANPQLLDSIQCINTRLNQVKQLKVFQMNQICEISALWRIVPNVYFPQGGKLFKANDIAARLLNI